MHKITLEVAKVTHVAIGKFGTWELDMTALPDTAIAYLFDYGVKQALNDARSAAKTKDEALALVAKKVDALMAGNTRIASARTGDPVMRRAKEIAKAMIEAALRKANKKADNMGDLVGALLAKKPEIMEQARKEVEAAQATAIDLDDLIG